MVVKNQQPLEQSHNKVVTFSDNVETATTSGPPHCIFGEAIVDTGASTSLLSSQFGGYLSKTRASTACIQGFEGRSEIKGEVRGIGHMYIIGDNDKQPGFQLSTNFDTIDNLNSNLFSVSSLYEDHNFSLMLRNKTHQQGKCELRRISKDGATQSIPIVYDHKQSAFIIKFVIGQDREEVARRGKEIEKRMHLSIKENMRLGSQSQICPMGISKMGIIMYAKYSPRSIIWSHDNKELTNINHNIEAHSSNTYVPMNFGIPQHHIALHLEPSPEGETNERAEDPQEPTQEEWNTHIFNETDGVIQGAKGGMKSREKKMSSLELHMRHGHIGGHEGKCVVCNLLRGSFRRIYKKVSPYIEQRVGHTFCGDVITWSDRSRQGSKYTMVLRDICSGYFFLLHSQLRNEFTRRIEELIISIRRNPIFGNLGRPIMSTLRLDPAGEWRDDNVNFQAMASRSGLHVTYSSPDDKRNHAHGENSVKQIEITARSILLNRALPTTFIEDACNQAACIRNYYPMRKECVSGDGDALRPLERISGGNISRREIDNRLHHLIPLGTPCLIYQPKNKGSNLQIPKARWGIALKMDKDVPIFFCPFRGPGSQFRSKNYIEYTLGIGINFYKFLGLEEPPMPSISLPTQRDRDIDITTITRIDNLNDLVGSTTYGPPPIQEVRDPSLFTKPMITLADQDGWIYEHDSSGDITKSTKRLKTHGTESPSMMEPEPHMTTQSTTAPTILAGQKYWTCHMGEGPHLGTIIEYDPTSMTWSVEYSNGTSTRRTSDQLHHETKILDPDLGERGTNTTTPGFPSLDMTLEKCPQSFVGRKFWKTFDGYDPCQGTITEYHPSDNLWSISYPDGDTEDLDQIEMHESFERDHIKPTQNDSQGLESLKITKKYPCKEGENFLNVCDSMGIPIHHRKHFYKWLGDAYGQFGQEWDPRLPKRIGIYFNYPWGRGRKTLFRAGTRFPYPSGKEWVKLLLLEQQRELTTNSNHQTARAARQAEKRVIMSEWLRDTFRKETPIKEKKSLIDITNKDTGKINDPRNLRDAMCRPDKALWEIAIRKELDALDDLEVLSHGHRLGDIRKMGISTSPVPMQLLYDIKYHPDGGLDKYKVRNVVQGHKGYMRKGEHFYNTFSASPSCRTTRLLQALTIGIGLKRYAWDICTAYLWADVRPEERMPIRYPRDLRRTDPETGEELYAILKKNCYGMPQADRRYTQLRNKFILTEFNTGGWSCFKSRQDPCLFIFTSPKGTKSYVIIHTDDCDGHSHDLNDLIHISKKFHDRFKIKVCDPRFMLGVQRDITTNETTGELTMTLTQPDFIETTFNTFKSMCSNRDIHTPFPPKMVLHCLMEEPDPIKSQEIIDRGYQSVAGSILWAARNCYPEASLGANMICQLMSKPTELAWKCALHTLKYRMGQQHRGIQYRSNGNPQPICYYDASNKADPSDGKSQYGYVIFLFNGSIV